MGQIYSFLGYGNTVRKNYQAEIPGRNFSCEICLQVLHDPVQCQSNEHYFCRKCITKHLENSETCPLCMDQLTLETLRSLPRRVANVVSELNKPCCRHVSGGCTKNIKVEDVLLHKQTCGYAPVVWSNDGCKDMVNRRDQQSHETEESKLRKITCESCNVCNEELNTQSYRQETRPYTSSTAIRTEKSVPKGEIFIFGGGNDEGIHKSFDVFNWSTKTWTLTENCLNFHRFWSYSFIYGNKIMICGGIPTERIEYLNPNESGYTATIASVSLSDNAR